MQKYKLYALLSSILLSSFASAACNLTYNANGSLMIDTQCNHYQYNAKEQLIAIKSPKRGLQCNYTYSPEGLRDAKICRSSDNHRLQLDFIYQNNQLINAEDRQHNSQSAYLGKDVRYVVNAFKQNAYYFSAAVHSTTSLLLTATANLKQTYNFSSYGQNRLFVQNNPSRPINFSQPLTYNPLTYDGEYQDPETGFVYLRARFYNPRQLRFMQRDNYNILNRYNAFDNNPISNTDPSGHFSLSSLSLYSSIASMGFGLIAPITILPEALPFMYGLSGVLNVFSTGISMIGDHTASHLAGNAMAMTGMALSTVGMMSKSSLVNFGLNLADNTLEGAAMPMISSDQGGISAKKMAYGALAALPTAIFLAGTSAYLFRSLKDAEGNLIGSEKTWGQTILAPDAGLKNLDVGAEKVAARETRSVLIYAKPMLLGGIRTASAEYIRKATFFPISQALGEHYQYTKTSLATNMLLGAASGAYMFSSMAYIDRNIDGSTRTFMREPINKFSYNFFSSGWSVQFGLPTLESI
ncbi:RHS repeat-associated core domain-containing protein [Facilibium subflavum]|uniref:RHS repeat-associated core domain-containing protein n=1 Tax=Facilibium subflavum TaxID=2219058 RepID=UPI000E65E903|nr:RHS repeat-associated core domain-containing protein [Facilibium subflavum]